MAVLFSLRITRMFMDDVSLPFLSNWESILREISEGIHPKETYFLHPVLKLSQVCTWSNLFHWRKVLV